MTVRILHGDCREVLKKLADGSVHCVVTSPPYFGLRDYGAAGQIGLEASPSAYVAEMVDLFREIRRVLRDDGIAWLNLGDSYAGSWGAQGRRVTESDDPTWHSSQIKNHPKRASGTGSIKEAGLKPKDLMMIPARVAIALQDDGWWLRSNIAWVKPNPMPESTDDRPTSSHEAIFLLAKAGASTFWTHRDLPGVRARPEPDYRWLDGDNDDAETAEEPAGWQEERSAAHPKRKRWRRLNLWRGRDYFYDAEAVREPMAAASIARLSQDVENQAGSLRANGGTKTNGPMKAVAKGNARSFRGGGAYTGGRSFDNDADVPRDSVGNVPNERGTRNLRNVWTIATRPFTGAHFATFPPDLPELCIKAGTSERGCCPTCGAPWARNILDGAADLDHQIASGAGKDGEYRGQSTKDHDSAGVQNASDVKRRILEGMREKSYEWRQTCACPEHTPVPCTVLDPFFGAGTTGLVADRLGRDCIGIELNPDYVGMAERRLQDDAGLFTQIAAE